MTSVASMAEEKPDNLKLWGGARLLDSESIEHPRLIYLLTTVPGEDSLVTYRYENDQLYEAVYEQDAYEYFDLANACWEEIENMLTQQYGEKEAEFRKKHLRPFFVPAVYKRQTNLTKEEVVSNHLLTAADRVMTLLDYTQRFVKNEDGSSVYILNRLLYINMGEGKNARYTVSTSFTYFDAENTVLIEQDLMSE